MPPVTTERVYGRLRAGRQRLREESGPRSSCTGATGETDAARRLERRRRVRSSGLRSRTTTTAAPSMSKTGHRRIIPLSNYRFLTDAGCHIAGFHRDSGWRVLRDVADDMASRAEADTCRAWFLTKQALSRPLELSLPLAPHGLADRVDDMPGGIR